MRGSSVPYRVRKRMKQLTVTARAKPFRGILLLLFTAMLFLGIAGQALAMGSRESEERHYLVAEVDGMINPVTQRFISRVIDQGVDDGAEVVIIKLDTPGGLLSSTRKIVEDLLSDRVATVVYVYPPGAQAASAGTFITAAAMFAVMAPGTNIGAAAPVASAGEDIPETLKSKVVQDTTALMRAIAAQRDRNADALVDTVTEPEPRAYSDHEAVKLGVVDFRAESEADLLRQIDGETVEIKAESGPKTTKTLDTSGLIRRETNMNVIEKFLFFLADPNISFLLLSLGGLGLVVELFNPGVVVPGVVGAIFLILAFLSFGNLPVNWAGVALILLAMVLLIAEIFVSGFGVLGIGAIVCFILGGLILFGGTGFPGVPSQRVSLGVLLPFAAIAFAGGGWVMWTITQSRGKTKLPKPDPSPLVGTTGVATTDLAPRGTVQVANEVWTAVSGDGTLIETGDRVKVTGVEGTILTVARAEEMAV